MSGSPERQTIPSGSLAAETDAHTGGESRLKADCSQDWLPHKAGRLTIGRRLPTCPTKHDGSWRVRARVKTLDTQSASESGELVLDWGMFPGYAYYFRAGVLHFDLTGS